MKPPPLLFESFSEEELQKQREYGEKISILKYNIAYMDTKAAKEIYDKLDRTIEYLIICPLYNIWNREVLHVIWAKYEDSDDETLINQRFYRSSGTSRGVDIQNLWFPGGEIDFENKRIGKLEDSYYDKLYKAVSAGSSALPMHPMVPIIVNGVDIMTNPDVGQYKRFVTKAFTQVSRFLYKKNSVLKPIIGALKSYTNASESGFDTRLLNTSTEQIITQAKFKAEVETNMQKCRKKNYIILF